MKSVSKNKVAIKKAIELKQATVYYFNLKTNLNYSYGHVASQPFIIVKVEGEHCAGYGECIGNNVVAVKKALQEMLHNDVSSLEASIPGWMDERQFRREREAISVALYDLGGKVSGVPVTDLLGGAARKQVPGIPVLLIDETDTVVAGMKSYIDQGFKAIKLKFSGNLEKDLLELRIIREIAGDDFFITADANCGYKSFNETARALEEFANYNLAIFEDPLEGTAEQYNRLRGITDIKIMQDVYTRSIPELENVLVNEAADIINLHPNHQGGLGRALQKEQIAAKYDVPVGIGGCGLLGIATAAFQSLAAVIGLQYPCGELGGYFDHGIGACLVKKPYPIENGFIHISQAPGLGVDVDERLLTQLAHDITVIN